MEFRKLRLEKTSRREKRLQSPRITVRGYTGEFNTLGKSLLAQVCKAWGLPMNRPAALALHTVEDATEYQLCAVPVLTAGDDDVPVTMSQDSSSIRVDLYHYMNSINLHLGKRTRWAIYLKVAPGVEGKLCLFLDTNTDLEEIRRRESAAQGASDKSGPQART